MKSARAWCVYIKGTREYLPEKSRTRDYATELRISRQEKNMHPLLELCGDFFLRRKLLNLILNMIPNYLNILKNIYVCVCLAYLNCFYELLIRCRTIS